MKELKAYIRPSMAEQVIAKLESAGVKGMTVIDVSTLGNWVDPERTKLSMDFCEKYCTSVKIELVCADDEVENFIEVIIKNAHTGNKGDGKIFVSDILDAFSIRKKISGVEAL